MGLINKIIDRINRKKIEKLAREKIKAEKDSQANLSLADRLALSSYDWVQLQWNGHPQEFLIKNINVTDMALCGKYPNIMLHFIKTAKDQGLNLKDEDSEPIDYKALKNEEYAFYEEVARASMLTPTFQEVYDAIINLRKDKGIDNPIENIRDVIPYDFLEDLFQHHLKRWELDIKKKSEMLTLIGSDA